MPTDTPDAFGPPWPNKCHAPGVMSDAKRRGLANLANHGKPEPLQVLNAFSRGAQPGAACDNVHTHAGGRFARAFRVTGRRVREVVRASINQSTGPDPLQSCAAVARGSYKGVHGFKPIS